MERLRMLLNFLWCPTPKPSRSSVLQLNMPRLHGCKVNLTKQWLQRLAQGLHPRLNFVKMWAEFGVRVDRAVSCSTEYQQQLCRDLKSPSAARRRRRTARPALERPLSPQAPGISSWHYLIRRLLGIYCISTHHIADLLRQFSDADRRSDSS